MINQILKVLKDKGIIKTLDLSDYTYHFNNRANISMLLSNKMGGMPPLFLKISDLRNMEDVFNAMKRINEKFPQIIPEPLCFFNIKTYHVLVTRAYDFDLLITKPHFQIKERVRLLSNVVNNICKLESDNRDGFLKFDERYCYEKLHPKINKFLERWKDSDLSIKFKLHLENLKNYYGLLIPRIPQHGDLVMFNIGFINSSIDKLIFIDWDDYSKIELPGYDFLIFTQSWVDFYGEDMYGNSIQNNHLQELFSAYIDSLGIDRELVIDLYPIFWALFAGLKGSVGSYEVYEYVYREIWRYFNNKERFILN